MADLYVITGTTNPSANGTEEVILARDKETGEVTKAVSTTQPAELTKADQEVCESLGVVLKKVTASEAEEIEEHSVQAAASDTAGAAPVFDQGSKESAKAGSGSHKSAGTKDEK